MKTSTLLLSTLLAVAGIASAGESKTLLQKALFAEEVEQDKEKSAALYQRMVDQAESGPKQLAVARYRIAKLHLASGRRDAAAKQLQALTTDPGVPADWVAQANKLLGEIQPKAEKPQVAEQAELYELLKDKLWDWNDGQDVFGGHKGAIRLLPDGKIEATCDVGELKGWNSAGRRVFTIISASGEPYSYELAQNGREAFLVGRPGIIDPAKRLTLHPTSAKTIEEVDLEYFSKLATESPDSLGNGDLLRNMFERGRDRVVRCLLEHGIPTETREKGEFRRPLLNVAVEYGSDDSVKMLLDHRADVNAPDARNQTPLIGAASRGRSDVVAMLLDRGANLEDESNGVYDLYRDPSNTLREVSTALHTACIRGSLPTVSLLLDRGANINATTARKHATPLITAMDAMHLEVAKELLARGANPNLPEDGRVNPLRQMAHEGQVEMVRLLLAKGARYDLQSALPVNSGGVFRATGSALHTAAREGRLAVAKVLVEAGCPVDLASPEYQETPLHAAALNGNTAMVKWLLEKGADPKRRLSQLDGSQSGWSPLHSASLRGSAEVAELLMAKGASPADVCGDAGQRRPALHLAVTKGCLPVVKSMLAQPAYQDTEARKQLLFQGDAGGNTALHLAVSRNTTPNPDIVRLLLASGASPDLTNTENLTPAQLAVDPARGTRDEAVRDAIKR